MRKNPCNRVPSHSWSPPPPPPPLGHCLTARGEGEGREGGAKPRRHRSQSRRKPPVCDLGSKSILRVGQTRARWAGWMGCFFLSDTLSLASAPPVGSEKYCRDFRIKLMSNICTFTRCSRRSCVHPRLPGGSLEKLCCARLT